MALPPHRRNGHSAATRLAQRGARARRHLRLPPQLLGAAPTPKSPLGKWLAGATALVLIVLALIPAAGAAAGGVYYSQTATQLRPRLEAVQTYRPFQTSRIFDRNGELLYEFVPTGRRDPVKLDQVSKYLKDATIAIEDKNFYTNSGVDYEGIIKAIGRSLNAGEETGGASTITQQVVRNIVLTDEEKNYNDRYQRKIKEAILAQQLTDEYSKDQILELYLNEINYGNLSYGIQAAAQGYFGKDAKDLNLNEASLIAGLGQLPTYYNPIQYVQENRLPGVPLKDGWRDPAKPLPNGTTPPRQRQVDVLRQMVVNGMVTEREARDAIAQDLVFGERKVSLKAPHFVFHVLDQLEAVHPEINRQLQTEGGLTITTTLDLGVQQIAQDEAAKRIRELEEDKRNIHNASVVVMQPNTGQILAMVGSIDYNGVRKSDNPNEPKNVLDGEVNVATRERQPGSALKPFTYLSAMNQGKLTPGSILWDVQTQFPIRGGASDKNLKACAPDPGAFWFCPKNYDQKWHGPLRMREGMANSLNIPAVLALKRAGIKETQDMLHSMGISGLQRDPNYYGLAMTLGGGEVTALDLTTAYNTLASDGKPYKAEPFLKITDRDGKSVYEFKPYQPAPPVDPALVAIVRDWMGDNEARTPLFGRNNPLKLSRPLHAKTGTTDDFRDAWALGYTPYVTVGVWTGNNNNEATERVESTQGGGVILNRVMERFFKDERVEKLLRGSNLSVPLDFPSPETFGAIERPICKIGGKFGQRSTEWFTPKMLEAPDPQASGSAKTSRSRNTAECDLYRTVEVVQTGNGGVCAPVNGDTFGGVLKTVRVWNLPKSTDDEKILDTKFRAPDDGSDDEDVPGAAPAQACTPELVALPTPTPAPSQEPQPGEPGQPGAPAANRLPNLAGLGENQAKELLASLGVTNVQVQYQTREQLGDLFDQVGPYVVVSSLPGAGAPIEPGMLVILGVRAP